MLGHSSTIPVLVRIVTVEWLSCCAWSDAENDRVHQLWETDAFFNFLSDLGRKISGRLDMDPNLEKLPSFFRDGLLAAHRTHRPKGDYLRLPRRMCEIFPSSHTLGVSEEGRNLLPYS